MTLVEIMITLVISSIIAASTFMFFAGQQRIYETQTRLLNIQQNLWAAMEVLARYTRASGSGMFECVTPASYYAPVDNGQRILSAAPSPGPLTSDLATIPQTGIRAFNAATTNMQFIPPLWIINNDNNATDIATPGVVANTDVLSVAFGNRSSGTDVDAPLALNFASTAAGTAISLSGTNTGNMFRLGEFILLLTTPNWGWGTDPSTNNRGCTMFQITADPTNSVTLAHAAVAVNTGGIVWNPSPNVAGMLPGGGYTGGAAGVRNFGQLTWVTFFINTGANGIPNLMMQQRHLAGASGQPQILAEGIEDLQVSFACDTGTLGTPNLTQLNGQLDEGNTDATKINDEWWNNVPGDNLPAINTAGYCNLPTAVRLTLVVRTLTPDDLINNTVTDNGPMNVEDHQYSPRPQDKYRRRVLTTTVYPRNNKPQ
jgi:type II secretory pathway pseudopilin PulG